MGVEEGWAGLAVVLGASVDVGLVVGDGVEAAFDGVVVVAAEVLEANPALGLGVDDGCVAGVEQLPPDVPPHST